MFSSLKKSIFIVLSVFLCTVTEKVGCLPNPLYVNATQNTDYKITATRAMKANGFCEIRIPGAIETEPYNKTFKIQHPSGSGSEYKKAAIYIIASIGAGDATRLSDEFLSVFGY